MYSEEILSANLIVIISSSDNVQDWADSRIDKANLR